MESLCKSGSLFEVTVPDYKQLKACHREVRLLKELWDMIFTVRTLGAGARAPAWLASLGRRLCTQLSPTCHKPCSSSSCPLLSHISLLRHWFKAGNVACLG